MNPTRQQFEEMSARVERARAAKGQGAPLEFGIKTAPAPAAKKRVRQSSKPLMNKLEADGMAWAERFYGTGFRAQAVRFRLGNGIWYKPDAVSKSFYTPVILEFKGPHAFRGGFENLKVAAALYPEWNWVLCWKDNGEWTTQKILP